VVLVVEDDDDVREGLTALLVRRGRSVHAVADGAQALAWLRTEPAPCVVLLDLMMPVMDGFELRREMMGDPVLASIPVVLLSAADNLERAARVLRADGWISKPYQVTPLLAIVDRLCGTP